MSGLRTAARAKPVIVLKVGRHQRGAQAASTHTGALIGSDDVFDAALERAGVVLWATLAGVAVKAQGAHADVQISGFFPGQFADATGCEQLGELHLKQPVLGGHKSLGHQKIFQIPGIDVSHAFFIPHDLYGCLQTGQF